MLKDRFMRRPEVERITGLSPPPVKIGTQASAWPESVINNWMAERIKNHTGVGVCNVFKGKSK